MNILMIKPYWPYPYNRGEYTYNRIWPPLSLLNCAGLLENNGFRVKILDAHAQRIKPKKIHNYIQGFDKIFITSSSLDRWQCPNIEISLFLDTVKEVRKNTSEVYILGYHGTLEPERILNDTKAKAVVRAEPEAKVLKICQGRRLDGIFGLTFKKGQEIISTENSSPLDLNNLSAPAYHLININRYFYEILGKRFALIEGSRGCNFNCNFCSKLMYPGPFRKKDSKNLIAEIKCLIEKHKVKFGYFIDLDFSFDKEQVTEICNFLISKKYNFRWSCQARIDSLEPDLLKIMKQAGCRLIHLGIEASNQNNLNKLNKNIKIEQIKDTVKACKFFKIKTLGFYLFGLPGETDQDRIKTLEFALKINTDFVSFHRIIDYKDKYFFLRNSENLKINKFIHKALLKYYFRVGFILQKDILSLIRCFKLGYGRMRSL